MEATKKLNHFHCLYPLDLYIKEKIEIITTKIYGAEGVNHASLAEKKIKLFNEVVLDKLPLCIAKTHLSLSHDLSVKGKPRNLRIPSFGM